MGVSVVAARGLVKTYGRGRAARRVLDEAAISVDAGELVAVVGRSGTGKSTLLHLLGALDRPEAGRDGLDHILAQGLEPLERAALIALDKPRVADHVRCEHGG